MIKHMIRKCIWRSGNWQADKWMKNYLSYTATGIRLQNMLADKSATDRENSQTKLQRKENNTNQVSSNPWSQFSLPVCMQYKRCEIRHHSQGNCMAGSNGQTIPNTRLTADTGPQHYPGSLKRETVFAPVQKCQERQKSVKLEMDLVYFLDH